MIKRTRELYYGQTPVSGDGGLVSESASPAAYLRRMALQAEVFLTDFHLEGIVIPEDSLYLDDPAEAPQIVISQRWIESEGVASFSAIGDHLTAEGFRPVPRTFYGWARAADGVVILDASPDNFIMTRAGLVPIDLQMAAFTPEEFRAAGLA